MFGWAQNLLKNFVYKKRPDRQNARWTLFISAILFSPHATGAYSSLVRVDSALLPVKHLIKEPSHANSRTGSLSQKNIPQTVQNT